MTKAIVSIGYNIIHVISALLGGMAFLAVIFWSHGQPHTYTSILTVYPGIFILYASITCIIALNIAWSYIAVRTLFGRPAIVITDQEVAFFTWRAYRVRISSIDRDRSMVVGRKVLKIADAQRNTILQFRLNMFEEDAMAKIQAALGYDLKQTE